MELSKLDTKSPQEEGAFLQLRHPKFGHLLWTGADADGENRLKDGSDDVDPDEFDVEPIGVTVRGLEAPSVKAVAQKIEDQMARKPGTVPQSRKPKITDEEAGLRMAEVLVVEFHGLTKDGEPLQATKESVREFFQLSDDLVTQVLNFARTKENFFKGTSKP